MCAFVGETSHIVQFGTFDQCEGLQIAALQQRYSPY